MEIMHTYWRYCRTTLRHVHTVQYWNRDAVENFIPSIPLSLRYIYHHSWKDALIMTCELQSWQKDIRTIYLHPLGHSFFFPAWFNSPHGFEILCFGCSPSPITTLYLLENVLKVHHSSRKSLRLCSELAVQRTVIDSNPSSYIWFDANPGEKKVNIITMVAAAW